MTRTEKAKPARQSATPPKRGRGRPRKTHDEINDGNRRLALLKSAAKLFRRKSFGATTTRDIAVEVGMHNGSSYYHFKSKKALLLAVMEEGLTRGIRHQIEMLQSFGLGPEAGAAPLPKNVDPRRLLAALIRNHLDILLIKEREFVPVMLFEWRSLTPHERRGIGRLQDEYEAVWMRVLESLHRAGQLVCEVKLARLMLFGALNWTSRWFETSKTEQGGLDLDGVASAASRLILIEKA